MRRPDFFIVGAPKCGTSAMFDFLAQHPDVFLAPKEIHFFGSDLRRLPFEGNESGYFELFASATNETRIGEASVWYLYSHCAAAEIKQFSPAAKIIISLRNPVEMIYSLHSQMIYNGVEDTRDFEQAWKAETAGRVLPFWKGPAAVKGMYYRQAGSYTAQVQRYLNVFGAEKVIINIFDDFKQEPLAVYHETCRFLGLSTEFVPKISVVNPNKKARSAALQKILLDPPRSIKTVGKLITTLRARERAVQYLKEMNTKSLSRPPMSETLRRELENYFAADIESLSQLLGRDLSCWRSSSGTGPSKPSPEKNATASGTTASQHLKERRRDL
jgi:sulfotransferase family protein